MHTVHNVTVQYVPGLNYNDFIRLDRSCFYSTLPYHSFALSWFSFPSRYNVEEDKWTKVANMHSKRIGVGCTVVNRLLYAVGGFDGQHRLSSVECYHPENDEWLEVKPMKRQRSGAGKSVD